MSGLLFYSILTVLICVIGYFLFYKRRLNRAQKFSTVIEVAFIANAELAIVQKLNMLSWKRRDPEGYEKYLKVQQQKTQEKKEDNSYVYKV